MPATLSTAGAVRLSATLLAVLWAAPAASAKDGDASGSADPTVAAWSAFEDRRAALAALAGGSDGSAKSTTASADLVFAAGFEPPPTGGCDSDRDGDALPDCVETDTGVFNGIEDTGTDPDNADTDGDGLNDGDEVVGTAGGLDLPALGVSPLRRDLLIEYDWFEDATGCNAHTHAPAPEVVARVEATFADAAIVNPDGSTGMNIVQDYGQGGALTGGNRIAGHSATLPGTFDTTWRQIRDENFDPRRRGYFRYVLLPHAYNGGSSSSGYAEIVGDDAIVSMACAIKHEWVGNTIVHELGHLLGLHHGGFEACNGKPNYNSLMNYRYQFGGTDTSCTADGDNVAALSLGDRLVIDEAAVDEYAGVCGAPAIDWNGNGALESGIALDLNPEHAGSCGSTLRTLEDFDDWGHVTFLGLLDAKAKLGGIQQHTACAGAPLK